MDDLDRRFGPERPIAAGDRAREITALKLAQQGRRANVVTDGELEVCHPVALLGADGDRFAKLDRAAVLEHGAVGAVKVVCWLSISCMPCQ